MQKDFIQVVNLTRQCQPTLVSAWRRSFPNPKFRSTLILPQLHPPWLTERACLLSNLSSTQKTVLEFSLCSGDSEAMWLHRSVRLISLHTQEYLTEDTPQVVTSPFLLRCTLSFYDAIVVLVGSWPSFSLIPSNCLEPIEAVTKQGGAWYSEQHDP